MYQFFTVASKMVSNIFPEVRTASIVTTPVFIRRSLLIFTFQAADLMLTVRPLLVRVLFIRRKKFLSLDCSACSFLLRPERNRTKLTQWAHGNVDQKHKNKSSFHQSLADQATGEMTAFIKQKTIWPSFISGAGWWFNTNQPRIMSKMKYIKRNTLVLLPLLRCWSKEGFYISQTSSTTFLVQSDSCGASICWLNIIIAQVGFELVTIWILTNVGSESEK